MLTTPLCPERRTPNEANEGTPRYFLRQYLASMDSGTLGNRNRSDYTQRVERIADIHILWRNRVASLGRRIRRDVTMVVLFRHEATPAQDHRRERIATGH